ncbi:MAG: F0F1 ATP synthase subunit B [Actinomycetota bacterium]|jgi:F-type H+-transporting ATPase subunit b|nr:F0F1 ATP synthase subunit B [Actinomycetota bacterium]
MMIGSDFLVPNATFIVELVAFVIVLVFIARVVLPPLNAALTRRTERIRAELEAAEEAKSDAAAADEERRAALDQARQQAREIVAQANRTAEQVSTDAQARGQAEYERLLSAAEAEVRLARERAVEEAAARLGQLVVDVVERILGREVDIEAHRTLIDEAAAALAAGGEAAGSAAAGSSSGGSAGSGSRQ